MLIITNCTAKVKMSLTTIQKVDQYVPVHDILTLTNNNLQIVFDPCEKPYNVDTSGWF